MSDRLQAMKARVAPREIETSLGPVLVRPIRVENLVLAGVLPLTLVTKLQNLSHRPGRSKDRELQDTIEALPAVKAILFAAAVDPRIGETTTDEVMGWDEFSNDDHLLIVTEALRPAAELAPFPARPEEPEPGAVDAPDGGDLRGAAERPAGAGVVAVRL